MRITGIMWAALSIGAAVCTMMLVLWDGRRTRRCVRATARHAASVQASAIARLDAIIQRDGTLAMTRAVRESVTGLARIEDTLTNCAAGLAGLGAALAPRSGDTPDA